MLFRANASSNNNSSDELSCQCDSPADALRSSSGPAHRRDATPELIDARAEDDASAARDNSAQLHTNAPLHRTPLPSSQPSKFHSLKRKLFPSRMRTALPSRIPPLVTSPIAASVSHEHAEVSEAHETTTLADATSSQHSELPTELERGSNNREAESSAASLGHVHSSHDDEDQPVIEDAPSTFSTLNLLALAQRAQDTAHEPHDISRISAKRALTLRNANDDDDDDLELEIALETLDIGAEQETLEEVRAACVWNGDLEQCQWATDSSWCLISDEPRDRCAVQVEASASTRAGERDAAGRTSTDTW